jgi:hypothetical protein
MGNMLGNAIGALANHEMQVKHQENVGNIRDFIHAVNGIDEANRALQYNKDDPEAKKQLEDLTGVRDRLWKEHKNMLQKALPNMIDPSKNKEEVHAYTEAVQQQSAAALTGKDNETQAQSNVSNKSDIAQGQPPSDPQGVGYKSTGAGVSGQMQQPLPNQAAANVPPGAGMPVQVSGATMGNQPGQMPQLFRRPGPGQEGTITTPASRMTPAAQREAQMGQPTPNFRFPTRLEISPTYAAQVAHEQKMDEEWQKSVLPALIREEGANARVAAQQEGLNLRNEANNVRALKLGDKRIEAELMKDARARADRNLERQLRTSALTGGRFGSQTINQADKLIKDINTDIKNTEGQIKDAQTDIKQRNADQTLLQSQLDAARKPFSWNQDKNLIASLEQRVQDNQDGIKADEQKIKAGNEQLTKSRQDLKDSMDKLKALGIPGVTGTGVSGLDLTGGGTATPSPGMNMIASQTPISVGRSEAGYFSQAALDPLINKSSSDTGVPRNMIAAVLQIESGGKIKSVSETGATGMMQLTQGTAAKYGVKDRNNPAESIRGGSEYLRDLLNAPWAGGDPLKAVAGYTVGDGLMAAAGGDISKLPTTYTYAGGYKTNPRQNAINYVTKFAKLTGYGGGGVGGGTTVSAGQPPTIQSGGGSFTGGTETATRGKPSAAHPAAGATASTGAPSPAANIAPNEAEAIKNLLKGMGITEGGG